MIACLSSGRKQMSTTNSMHGKWVRSGARSAKGIGLRFVVEPDGKIKSAERVRLEISFGDDSKHIQGSWTLAQVDCTTEPTPPGSPFPEIPVCPDMTTTEAEVIRGPIPLTAIRLDFNAPNP